MNVIILAAGQGSRLRPHTDNKPKCLVEVEGISLLDSKRSEFEPILRQEGIDAVLKLMREKIEQPVGEQVKQAQDKDAA